MFGTAILNFGSLIFASRPADVMEMYGMSQAQLTAVSTVSQLPGALLSVIIGNMLDRKGVRKITAVMLAVAAICMIWRVFAGSYVELFIITLLAGAFFLPISVAAPKCIGAWFPPNEMGLSMGIYGAAARPGHHSGVRPGQPVPLHQGSLYLHRRRLCADAGAVGPAGP